MRKLALLLSVLTLTACGSKGPPIPDWKTDSSNFIERYKKTYLMGENMVADRFFEQAVNATSGGGKIAETARLWLIQCALHKATLVTDSCEHYVELAKTETSTEDKVYFQFLAGQWDQLDVQALPAQYAPLVKASSGDIARCNEALRAMTDPLSRLIGAGLLLERKQVNDETLALATQTASDQGWRRPLLVYLKLRESRAKEHGDTSALGRLAVQIKLVEEALVQIK
ncbi:MAG: lipoprotein [Thiobacillaceae bacterium]